MDADEPDGPFSIAGVDFERANAARMYDYYLGGAHNFAADREMADRVIDQFPGVLTAVRANRTFLNNAVRWCLEHGIDQFLDLGSGVPTVGNVHEVALAVEPTARVAYVDFEPVAVAHAQEVIGALGNDNVTVTRADLREPTSVLTAPAVAGLLDFGRPVAVLMVAVLHFVDDEHWDLARIVGRYRDAVAPGSALVLSHSSDDIDDSEAADGLTRGIRSYRGSATPLISRSRAEIHALLTGFDLVEPGLVDVADWPRPATTAGPATLYGAVGVVAGHHVAERSVT